MLLTKQLKYLSAITFNGNGVLFNIKNQNRTEYSGWLPKIGTVPGFFLLQSKDII